MRLPESVHVTAPRSENDGRAFDSFEVGGALNEDFSIRAFRRGDEDGIWAILEPVLRAGASYALPTDTSKSEALAYWLGGDHDVFVAECRGELIGTYYQHPNQRGGGSHVANCGYAVASEAGGRGVGARMCAHSLELARSRGFAAMQFNFVVSTNELAVRLWQRHGFGIVGCLPNAFRHSTGEYTDVYVMYRLL